MSSLDNHFPGLVKPLQLQKINQFILSLGEDLIVQGLIGDEIKETSLKTDLQELKENKADQKENKLKESEIKQAKISSNIKAEEKQLEEKIELYNKETFNNTLQANFEEKIKETCENSLQENFEENELDEYIFTNMHLEGAFNDNELFKIIDSDTSERIIIELKFEEYKEFEVLDCFIGLAKI